MFEAVCNAALPTLASACRRARAADTATAGKGSARVKTCAADTAAVTGACEPYDAVAALPAFMVTSALRCADVLAMAALP
ncbi:MAG TPA: hypothetical protein PK667_09525 [Nitrosomonas europaea]|uniref:hypothetical protein n=1 Tax=Nitrosomonas europaea TaxID=915 RepID=UPI002490087C|nr:hypothetical protein [Nitrosomonas europaea]HRO56897.1 hypothetical protein [Nitrosomonas europaea]HUM74424.1 hypothetical protein [Nitrosomonas europaea]